MPPFVGAVAMQLLFGRSGSVNLLLNDAFGFTIPFMDGLNGVIFVESLHYFPFILLNLVGRAAQHRRRDGGVGAEPRRLGLAAVPPHRLPARPARLRRRRLARVRQGVRRPRHAARARHVTNMLAPQAYLRITSVGLEDPIGYVISVRHGRVLDRRAVGARRAFLKGRDFATLQRGGAALQRRELTPLAGGARLRLDRRWCCCWCSRRTSASCCMSLSKVWSFSRPARAATRSAHYATVFARLDAA